MGVFLDVGLKPPVAQGCAIPVACKAVQIGRPFLCVARLSGFCASQGVLMRPMESRIFWGVFWGIYWGIGCPRENSCRGPLFESSLGLRGGIFLARRLRKAGVVKADGV